MKNGLIMGIVNVTPDSFSDGGQFFSPKHALEHAESLMRDGADILDIGAESSRPNADPVSLEEEWSRLEPILTILDTWQIPISVDTYKPEIMRRLQNHRVAIINDIRGGSQVPDEILEGWGKAGRVYLGMHMHRDPKTMQLEPLEPLAAWDSVNRYYAATQRRLGLLGFPPDKIWLDPGIGFGKSDAANLYLIKESLKQASSLPLVLGISRKSFIGRLLDIAEPEARDSASKMLELNFLWSGVHAIRTHNVKHLKRLRDHLI